MSAGATVRPLSSQATASRTSGQARLGLRVGEAFRFGLQIVRGPPGQRDQLTLVAGPLGRGRDGERRLDRRARFHVLTELAMGQRDDAPEGSGFSRVTRPAPGALVPEGAGPEGDHLRVAAL